MTEEELDDLSERGLSGTAVVMWLKLRMQGRLMRREVFVPWHDSFQGGGLQHPSARARAYRALEKAGLIERRSRGPGRSPEVTLLPSVGDDAEGAGGE